VISVRVAEAGYDYDAELDYGTTYFWQIKVTEPFISEASPIFSFTVAPQEEHTLVSRIANLPLWLWIAIAVIAAASIAVLVISKMKPGVFKAAFVKARRQTTKSKGPTTPKK